MTPWLAGLIDFSSYMPCRAMEFNQIFCAVIQDTIKNTIYHLFPKDTSMYITILTDPVDQFESVFNYVELGEVFGLDNDPTKSIKSFLRNGKKF